MKDCLHLGLALWLLGSRVVGTHSTPDLVLKRTGVLIVFFAPFRLMRWLHGLLAPHLRYRLWYANMHISLRRTDQASSPRRGMIHVPIFGLQGVIHVVQGVIHVVPSSHRAPVHPIRSLHHLLGECFFMGGTPHICASFRSCWCRPTLSLLV